MTFPTEWNNKKNVPNHQPVSDVAGFKKMENMICGHPIVRILDCSVFLATF
jgi:hypothetical protein